MAAVHLACLCVCMCMVVYEFTRGTGLTLFIGVGEDIATVDVNYWVKYNESNIRQAAESSQFIADCRYLM